MARQKGVIKLQGQMGGVSFYKTGKDGFLAREKGGVDGERIKNDPNFARTRENGAEFGRAGSAGKLLRTAFRTLILSSPDGRMASRLTREMVKVIQADQVNTRGQRNVIDGEAALLQGFEFNENAKLGSTFFSQISPSINRATGICEVVLANYSPDQMVAAPAGATHYRLIMGAAWVDFQNGVSSSNEDRSAEIEINNIQTPIMTLSASVPAATAEPIFLGFGIEFFQQVNGAFYPLKNGQYNALSIVMVDVGP